jgi:hypothetical protein
MLVSPEIDASREKDAESDEKLICADQCTTNVARSGLS